MLLLRMLTMVVKILMVLTVMMSAGGVCVYLCVHALHHNRSLIQAQAAISDLHDSPVVFRRASLLISLRALLYCVPAKRQYVLKERLNLHILVSACYMNT